MKIPKEIRKKIINRLLVATGEPTQSRLFNKYGVSNFTKKTTTKHYSKLINNVMLKYCLQFVNVWELGRMARNAHNIERIKRDNVRYREEIRELREEIKELKNGKGTVVS